MAFHNKGLNLENISISTEKFVSEINNLINDWAPLKEFKNCRVSHGLPKSIKNNKQYKKMCRTIDLPSQVNNVQS